MKFLRNSNGIYRKFQLAVEKFKDEIGEFKKKVQRITRSNEYTRLMTTNAASSTPEL